jgi:HAD superfamily hydrolase (TIGR01509 family)
MTPGAVLLDLYDTLVWSEWFKLRDLMAARLGIGSAELVEAFKRTRPARGTGTYASAEGDMAAVIEAAGIDPHAALVAELTELERDQVFSGVHLYEDSLPVVRELRSRGIPVALVSNCSHSTRPVVERLRLEEEFDAVILSFEAGVLKPDAGIYRLALERLGVGDATATVFVDDQTRYCDGASALGISTRLIMRPTAKPFEGFDPSTNGHKVITDMHALLPV